MNTAQRQSAIVHAATECEQCMRLADFAEHEPLYGTGGTGIARGLRKLATYHSENAFLTAQALNQRAGGAA